MIFDTQGSGGFYKYSPEAQPMEMLAPWRVDFSRSGQLYDLEADPSEQKNLYEQHPEVIERLTAMGGCSGPAENRPSGRNDSDH